MPKDITRQRYSYFFNLILIYKDEFKFLKTIQYSYKNKVDKYICFNLCEYEV